MFFSRLIFDEFQREIKELKNQLEELETEKSIALHTLSNNHDYCIQ